MKMLDFEGSKGPKIVQNWYPGGFKSNNFQNMNCKAAAEGILEALGWKRGRSEAVRGLSAGRPGGMREAGFRLL